MSAPPNMIRTSISPLLLRQINGYNSFIELKRISVLCFFDKIDIHCSLINEPFLKNCKVLYENENVWGYQFMTGFMTSSSIIFIILKNSRFESPWKYKIVLQSTRKTYPKFSTLLSFLTELMGEVTITNHQLTRLDIGFGFREAEISIELLHYCSHLKWKNSESHYRGHRTDFKKGRITGFHSNGGGVRTSNYFEGGKPIKLQKNSPTEVKTEYQVKKGVLIKKEIITIFDLKKIAETNLLARVNFYDPVWIKKIMNANPEKIYIFQQDVLSMGFNQARKNNNEHRNFQRDIGKFFEPLRYNNGKATLSLVLQKRWMTWLQEWYNS